MKLSSELIQLQTTFRRFFEKEAPLSYIRKRFEGDVHYDKAFREKLNALALNEFFGESGGTIRELSLLAKEAGRSLIAETITDELLAIILSSLKPDLPTHLKESLSIPCGVICASFNTSETESFLCRGSDKARSIVFERNGEIYAADLKDKSNSIKNRSGLDRTLPLVELNIKIGSSTKIASRDEFPLSDYLSILRAAEVFGALEAVLGMTKEYVKTRRQFEVPIGGFQAVQHTMANMMLTTEALCSLIDFAAWACVEAPGQRHLSSISALTFACEKGPETVEASVQIHGGIGFTWDYDLHFYLRRVRSIAALHGGIEERAEEILKASLI